MIYLLVVGIVFMIISKESVTLRWNSNAPVPRNELSFHAGRNSTLLLRLDAVPYGQPKWSSFNEKPLSII